MEHLLIPAAIVFAAILIAEIVASIRFNRWYFSFGIPIFRRRIDRPTGLEGIDLDALPKSAATVAGAPIILRRLGPSQIAFREKVFSGGILYLPLMRGVIRHNPGEPAVTVTGLMNWSFVALPLAFIAVFGKKAVFAFGYIGLAIAVLYLIQGVRYWRLGNGLRSA